MKHRFKVILANRVTDFAQWLLRAQIFLTRRRAKYYLKCFANCHVPCSIEVWSKITGGTPVDFESQLYKTIKRIVEYYLYRSFRARSEPTFFERLILQYEFAYAPQTSAATSAEADGNFKFVLKYRIAKILKRYENIHKYIASVATTEIRKSESSFNESSSALYWLALVDTKKLPDYLSRSHSKFLLWRLRRASARVKRELAQNNCLKLDFTASDISSLVALSGTLLVLLGYLRITALCWYFGIPYERYFTITDYLSSSVSSVQTYLISAALAVILWWFLVFAPANAYSVQETEWRRRTLNYRLEGWAFHFLAFSSAVAAIVLYFYGEIVAAIQPLSVVGMYISFYFLGYLSRTYFRNPLKSYLCAALVAMCLMNGLSGVAGEIKAIISPKATSPSRTLQFEGADYSEPAWRVIAITSGFVILRRQLDGIIHVRNRSDLNSIVDSSAGQGIGVPSHKQASVARTR